MTFSMNTIGFEVRNCIVHLAPRTVVTAAAVALMGIGVSGAAMAQDFPEESVRIIVPYGPGGTSDTVTRAFAPAFEEALGQTVIVENISGSSGVTGTERLARSKADGYTLGVLANSITSTVPHIIDTNYHPSESFAAISQVVEGVTPFAVRGDFPVDTMQEFIDYAKENPGVTYASSGIGSNGHLCPALMSNDLGLNMQHVPFSGSRDSINSLLGGHVDAACDPGTVQAAEAGSIKALTVMNKERWETLPDVPTYKEVTGEEPPIVLYYSLVAPAGTPDDVIQVLNEATEAALSDEGTKQRFQNLGQIGVHTSPEVMQDMIDSDYENAGRRLEELGVEN